MPGEGHLDRWRIDRDARRATIHRVDEDRLAEPEGEGHRQARVAAEGGAVEEDAERVAAAAIGAQEDAQDGQLGHRGTSVIDRSWLVRARPAGSRARSSRP